MERSSQVDALVRAATDAAEVVRARGRVVAAAGGVEWVGPAARAFRDRLEDRAREVAACAVALDHLADAARAHAAAVRAHEASALALAHRVEAAAATGSWAPGTVAAR